MIDDQEKIKALKAATFAIEYIVSARARGNEPQPFDVAAGLMCVEPFDDYARGFASGIGTTVELAREMMRKPLCEIFEIDLE